MGIRTCTHGQDQKLKNHHRFRSWNSHWYQIFFISIYQGKYLELVMELATSCIHIAKRLNLIWVCAVVFMVLAAGFLPVKASTAPSVSHRRWKRQVPYRQASCRLVGGMCKKVYILYPEYNTVIYGESGDMNMTCKIETTGPFKAGRSVNVTWYFLDTKIERVGHRVPNRRLFSVERVNGDSGLAQSTLVYTSVLQIELAKTSYGLYRCDMDDGIEIHHRFYFIAPPGIDLQNDRAVGMLLSNGHITDYTPFSFRHAHFRLSCFTPHETRNQLTWHIFGPHTAEEVHRERNIKFERLNEGFVFRRQRNYTGQDTIISPTFGIQWHTIVFTLTADNTPDLSHIPFFCEDPVLGKRKFFIGNRTEIGEFYGVPPKAVVIPASLRVIETNIAFNVSCSGKVTDSKELPLSFVWLFNYKPLQNATFASSVSIQYPTRTSSVVSIQRAIRAMSGKFTCVVRNSFGQEAQAGTILDIVIITTFPPLYVEPRDKHTSLEVESGGKTSFTCEASGGISLKMLLYFKERLVLDDEYSAVQFQYTRHTTHNGVSNAVAKVTYNISRATLSHAGNYTCSAWNTNGIENRSIVVVVTVTSPSIALTMVSSNNSSRQSAMANGRAYAERGAEVRFKCAVVVALREPVSMNWVIYTANNTVLNLSGNSIQTFNSSICMGIVVGKSPSFNASSMLILFQSCTRQPSTIQCVASVLGKTEHRSATLEVGSPLKMAMHGPTGGEFKHNLVVERGTDVAIGTATINAWPPPVVSVFRNVSRDSPMVMNTDGGQQTYQCRLQSDTVQLAAITMQVVYSRRERSQAREPNGQTLRSARAIPPGFSWLQARSQSPALTEDELVFHTNSSIDHQWDITMFIQTAREADSGEWAVGMGNVFTTESIAFELSVLDELPTSTHLKGASGDVVFTIVLPVLAGTAVVALLIVVIVWRWHKRSVHRKMSRMKSKHDLELLKRRPTTSMLDFSIADQTTLTSVLSDLPPYDPEWNFSSENLSKPVEIGKGAFGVVYRAVATGILSGKETETTEVALKCSKDVMLGDVEVQKRAARDLVHEMNVLKSIGRDTHPNVLCLLGVCTDHGSLLLITEYCSNGNLLHFLRKRRGRMDFSGAGQSVSYDSTSADSSVESAVDFSKDPNSLSRLSSTKRSHVSSTMPSKDDVLRPLDFYQFASQIAAGMAFLSSHKCVHRDLAARNILINSEFVLKVSDFGLARSLAEEEHYMPISSKCVPIKWIAIESLRDGIYTLESDIWSFGILLWEIASLGCNPYPGVPAESLFIFLRDGMRMTQPEGCPDDMFKLMLDCWQEDPKVRPPFTEIETMLRSKQAQSKASEAGLDYLELDTERQAPLLDDSLGSQPRTPKDTSDFDACEHQSTAATKRPTSLAMAVDASDSVSVTTLMTPLDSPASASQSQLKPHPDQSHYAHITNGHSKQGAKVKKSAISCAVALPALVETDEVIDGGEMQRSAPLECDVILPSASPSNSSPQHIDLDWL